MGVQREDLKKRKTVYKNLKHRHTGKKTALKNVWYYKPWEAFLYTDLLFNADGVRYVDYLRAKEELRNQPPVMLRLNMLEVPND
jgi:hypothetical protein